MAGLGAGQGAHDGDMERGRLAEQQRQADLQARLQREGMAQRDQQFRLNLEADEAVRQDAANRFNVTRQDDLKDKSYVRGRQDRVDQQAAGQMEWERNRAARVDERTEQDSAWSRQRADKLDAERASDKAFERGRAAKQDAWSDALNLLSEEKHMQEIEQNRMTIDQYREKAKYDNELVANKQRMAKSNFAGLIISAMDNGGMASPSAIELYNKAVGGNVKGLYFLQNGGVVIDEDDGKGGVTSNFAPQDFVDNVTAWAMGNNQPQQTKGALPVRKAPVGGGVDPDRASEAVRGYERLLDAAEKALPKDRELDPAKYDEAMTRVNTLRGKYERLVDAAYGDLLPKDDDKGKLTFSNDAVKALYGMSPAEIKKRADLWASRAKTTPKQALSRLLANESPQVRAAIMSALD